MSFTISPNHILLRRLLPSSPIISFSNHLPFRFIQPSFALSKLFFGYVDSSSASLRLTARFVSPVTSIGRGAEVHSASERPHFPKSNRSYFYTVNRVKCEKVKAKCSFSMTHRDLCKLEPSKEYIDVFIYPSLMV